MPTMPPTLGGKSRAERQQGYDKDRRKMLASRRWYSWAAWAGPNGRRIRQLADQPFCAMCYANGGAMTVATVADHITPHREDADAFWSGALQSLCAACHSGDKQRLERAARTNKHRY